MASIVENKKYGENHKVQLKDKPTNVALFRKEGYRPGQTIFLITRKKVKVNKLLPLTSGNTCIAVLAILAIAPRKTVAPRISGVTRVLITLPILISAGNDLNMVNPIPANNAFKIPPRKPPRPLPLLFDFKLAS